MSKFKTEQETFWHGEQGDTFTDRIQQWNQIPRLTALFAKALSKTSGVNSIIEFGASIGNNIFAIKNILPHCSFTAVEINSKGAKILKERYEKSFNEELDIYVNSILEYKSDSLKDLSLIKSVLVTINPDELQNVYKKLYEATKKYILIVEYYNPTPLDIPYRDGGMLYKRDFAGELMDKYPDVKLIDYGFVYHRDPVFPLDDYNWFLMEKENR